MVKIETYKERLRSLGVTDEELASINTKEECKEWIDKLESLTEATVKGELEVTKEVVNEPVVQTAEEVVPDYYSSEWEQYVLSKFAPNELQDGKYPKLNGLRRIAPLLLGTIIDSRPVKVDVNMNPDVPGRASVTYEVRFSWKVGSVLNAAVYQNEFGSVRFEPVNYPVVTFAACGGSWHGNTDDAFAVYPEAIAESRAEARALRKALRLSVVSADEITSKDTAAITKKCLNKDGLTPEVGTSEKITNNQITAIRHTCKRLSISESKFLNMGKNKYSRIEDVPYETAKQMLLCLNSYQITGEDSREIPKEILEEKV